MQKCANCERDIGNLEEVYDFNGQSVCSECNQRLANSQQTNPSVTVTSGQITTERTGKQWKKLQLVGAILAVVGIVMPFCGAIALGGFSLTIGLIIFIYARIMAWWHHG